MLQRVDGLGSRAALIKSPAGFSATPSWLVGGALAYIHTAAVWEAADGWPLRFRGGMAEQEAAAGGQIPYIGSLISLVSASGQRYRGTLYTVDLNESTIALQNGVQLAPARTCLDTCHTLQLCCCVTVSFRRCSRGLTESCV